MRWIVGCLAHTVRVRLADILVLQGAPVLGLLFALSTLDEIDWQQLSLLLLGSTGLVAFVFLLNDWADLRVDRKAPAKVETVFTSRGVTPPQMLVFCLLLAAVSLAALALLSWIALILGAGIALTGVLYSWPAGGAKGLPVASSLAHLVGQLLQFLLGYTLVAEPDLRGLQLGAFFALVFVGGHLNQEVRDHETDRASGIRTNAVTFGQRPVFVVSLVLFSVAFAYLGWLAVHGVVERSMALLVISYPVYAIACWRAWAAGLGFASATRLKVIYRLVFVAVGIGIVVIRIGSIVPSLGAQR
jgi:4-hydroxybenzoate polyprenyltransferase